MTYVYNKYCRDKKRKAVAAGYSMGGDILANLIGHEGSNCFLSGVCLVQMAIKKHEMIEPLKKQLWGFYNYVGGIHPSGIIKKNEK